MPSNLPARGPADAAVILRSIEAVARERERRAADPALAARVVAVKAYQQTRFRSTHQALLASARHGPAARFFLDELYGPADFTRRDAQFARIVPALVQLFPQAIVDTVAALAELHALSEALDSVVAEALPTERVDPPAYVAAWRTAGARPARERQIDLALEIGHAIDRYTRTPMLALSLRMMRGPARAAGLSDLQAFLERGLDAFKAMRGADDFLAQVDRRERAFVVALFDAADPLVALAGELPPRA